MPKYREPYTVFPRKLPSGKIVYYYRTYSPAGERTTAHSTGKTNKTQAKNYCAELLAQGLLYSSSGMSFGVYAKGFFDDNSQWMGDKIQSGQGKAQAVAHNTLVNYRRTLDSFLMPFFQNIKLIDLRPYHIKEFRNKLIEQHYSNSVINLSCTCLKIILSYAKADRLIMIDPFISVPAMYVNAKKRGAFSLEQLQTVFRKEWPNKERKLFSLIATVTGMRISEISAIRKETLYENYIDVKDQFVNNKLSPVKDGEKRKVRVCDTLIKLMAECNNNGFMFPDAQVSYRRDFYTQLGLSKEERDRMGLSYHSLRHFCNTYLLTNGIMEIKVKCVLGHSSGKGSMTERYANFQPEHFNDVAELQEKLLGMLL